MIKGYANKEVGVVKTLAEWVKELQITTEKYTFATGNTYDTYKSAVKPDRHVYLDIYKKSGYGLSHTEFDSYMGKAFRLMNNDINDAKLVEA